MNLYNFSTASLTLFTIFLIIVPTVEVASISDSTHCNEGFALFHTQCTSVSSSITLYTRKMHTGKHKERVRDLMTLVYC